MNTKIYRKCQKVFAFFSKGKNINRKKFFFETRLISVILKMTELKHGIKTYQMRQKENENKAKQKNPRMLNDRN